MKAHNKQSEQPRALSARGPVFVDASGRRLRLAKVSGLAALGLVAGYVVLLLVAFMGGSNVSAPFLPLPAAAGKQEMPATPPAPAEGPAVPHAQGVPAAGPAVPAAVQSPVNAAVPAAVPVVPPASDTVVQAPAPAVPGSAPAPVTDPTAPGMSGTDPGMSAEAPGQATRPSTPARQ